MRKADVIAYRAHLLHLRQCVEYNLDAFRRHRLPESDASIQRHHGYLMAIDDAVEALDSTRSARVARLD